MTDERKQVAPTREHILKRRSSALSASPPPLLVLADIAVKTSGAPLANANNVTPANDSLILDFTVRYSREGAK